MVPSLKESLGHEYPAKPAQRARAYSGRESGRPAFPRTSLVGGYGLLVLLIGGPLYFLISVSTVEVGNQSAIGIGYSAAMSALLAGIGSMYVFKAALADIPPRYGYSRGSEERSCIATAALITLVLLVVRD